MVNLQRISSIAIVGTLIAPLLGACTMRVNGDDLPVVEADTTKVSAPDPAEKKKMERDERRLLTLIAPAIIEDRNPHFPVVDSLIKAGARNIGRSNTTEVRHIGLSEEFENALNKARKKLGLGTDYLKLKDNKHYPAYGLSTITLDSRSIAYHPSPFLDMPVKNPCIHLTIKLKSTHTGSTHSQTVKACMTPDFEKEWRKAIKDPANTIPGPSYWEYGGATGPVTTSISTGPGL